MSVQTSQSAAYRCDGPGCTAEFDAKDAVDGSYCSDKCSTRDDGQDLLNGIRYDHRWCHGCFRRCKEVEKPGERHPDCVTGFQYLTQHAERGEKTGRGVVDHDPDAPATDRRVGSDRPPGPADTLIQTGTVCECGTTDHRDDYLRAGELVSVREAAKRLCRAFAWTNAEGQNDKTIDARTLARTLRESSEERGEWDWHLAVGRAVE